MVSRLPLALAAACVLATAACDAGLEPEPVCAGNLIGVCGTVRFSGALPPNTEAVFVVAFPTFPTTCNELLALPAAFRPFPPIALPQPYQGDVAYGLPLPLDTYEWVVAVWKRVGAITFTPADTTLFRVAGYYRNPADPAQPGAVTLATGASVVGGVDMTVDFAVLRPVPDFVTCAAR